ncbi:hypothetical protein [Hyphomicrobium sp.]|uniref:hypothetical protein n=1 Tax=Hyphomicrobium sp. TaxID=82 RepID=UPI001DD0FD75|nr:hypothetical protein [Hyphomicrobium sp.]MBY0559863.1 hypothetical protein [Hyphomicrobium sp.]
MARSISNTKGTIKIFPAPKPASNVHSLEAAPGGQFVKRHPQRGPGAGSQRTLKPMPPKGSKGSSRGR